MLTVLCFTAAAQHIQLPKTDWQSYGFQKQVKQAAIGYYKSDSSGYEPVMLEVYGFNNEGQLTNKYIRIFGKFASETVHKYVYKQGVLDSINTLASARSFNATQKLHYNKDGLLQKITAKGAYTNFTDTYTYESSGMVAAIERKYQNGGGLQARFDHQKNVVTEKEIAVNGKSVERHFVYDGDELLASFTPGNQRPVTVTLYDNDSRSHFNVEITEETLPVIFEWRKLKQQNPKDFKKQISTLKDKSAGVALFDIPAESRNQNGDWIKRLQIDRQQGMQRRLVFQKLVYADGTESGNTAFDSIFERKVSNIN